MGDRANVKIAGVHLYTHWGGSALPFVVRDSLKKKWRWEDETYLARIIFCDMIRGQEDGETGFGISAQMCDNEHPILHINCENQEVHFLDCGREGGELVMVPFEEYISMTDGQLQQFLKEKVYW
jgi:hypothetical protein